MHAFRNPPALATRLRSASEPHRHELSPEQSATASSGTYRAVRPTAPATAAGSRSEATLDLAKIEGLRFELDLGIWQPDVEYIASRVVDDSAYAFSDE